MNLKKIILIVTIIVAVILTMIFVTAYNPFKWQLCESANITGGECDDYWDAFKTSMGIEENLSVTLDDEVKIYIDDEIEAYFQEYYNRSEVNEMIGESNTTLAIEQINKTLNIKFLTLRDELEEDFVTQREFDRYDGGSSGVKTSDLLIGIVVLVVVVILIVILGKKKAESIRKEETSSKSVDDLALEKAMDLLKKQNKKPK